MSDNVNEIISSNTVVSLIDNLDLTAVQETMRKINTFQAIVQSNLKSEHDYGVIPGANKPTLFKPGGEKICMLFGLNPEYEILSCTEDYKTEFFSYNIRCSLFRNGQPFAQGVGSCNSKEKKYRYINVSEIPKGYVGTSEQFTTSWGEVKYKIENPDICSLVNTILKMAKKRAFVDAVLQVASLSEIFVEDTEDMADFNRQEQQVAASSMTPEQAGAIKLRFGKHKGKSLGEIYRADKSYLEWLVKADKTEPGIRKACEIMVDAVAKKAEAKRKSAEEQPAAEQEAPKTDEPEVPFDDGDPYAGTPFGDDAAEL